MSEPGTYPHGVTCWTDTEQPESRFYGGLFGWNTYVAIDDRRDRTGCDGGRWPTILDTPQVRHSGRVESLPKLQRLA